MSQFSARVCEIWSHGYQIMVLLILAIYLCKSFRIRVSFPWKGQCANQDWFWCGISRAIWIVWSSRINLVELTRFCHFDRGGLLLPTVVLSLDLESSTPVVNCEFFAFSARALYAMMMFWFWIRIRFFSEFYCCLSCYCESAILVCNGECPLIRCFWHLLASWLLDNRSVVLLVQLVSRSNKLREASF